MGSSNGLLSKLLRRWSNQQESALHQLSERKAVGHRIAGISKSERLDAKFLLLALAPFAPVLVSDQIGLERGILWHAWFWISATWAVVIIGIALASYWRALRRSMRRKR